MRLNPLLSLHQLTKRRHDASSACLFQDITASVEPGERIALLGVSGQGKSTLLRILARLESADEGFVSLNGTEAAGWKPSEWRKRISYVAQMPVMLPGTVEDNLRTVSRLHAAAFDEPLAFECMRALGLEGIEWSRPASELSGGEKQRVALVRSLLLRPQALLLDETTASLDPASKRAVEQLLGDWVKREGTAYMWVTHDLDQARTTSDRVWFMGDGKLLESASTERFFRLPTTEPARRFIGMPGQAGQPPMPNGSDGQLLAPGKEGPCQTWL